MKPVTARGVFVTGTDTEVGKSLVSASLLRWCTQQGWRSAGFKPVAAGTESIDGVPVNEDVRQLCEASSLPLTHADVCPWQFDAACSPHIAARLEQRRIDPVAVRVAAQTLAQRADALVVEGAGGFCVPLGPDWDTADLAADLALPVVLVVGLRLGCINHALLTAAAVRARGLRLAGWVGNSIDPRMPWRDDNVNYLRERLLREYDAPCLGVLPWLPEPVPEAALPWLDSEAVHRVFSPGWPH